MFLGPTTTEYALDDKPWLGSADGTQATETITIDLDLFTKNTHYPEGVLLSGIPLAQNTTTKLWGPYAAGGANGLDKMEGHLYGAQRVVDGVKRYSAALFTRGKVRLSRLPAALRPDANGQGDVAGFIRYLP